MAVEVLAARGCCEKACGRRDHGGRRCRRQVWRRKTRLGAEDTLEGGGHIWRWKMHWKAEDTSEAEAESETERRGIRGFPLHCGGLLIGGGSNEGKRKLTTPDICRNHISS